MLRRILSTASLLLLVSGMLMLTLSTHVSAHTSVPVKKAPTLADFPTVDPNYIYDQLFYMVTHFQHREAGYDNNLPVNVNGHDEFANYWSQEASKDLQGFNPQIRKDSFPIQGWRDRPATVPAFNVEVSVPGVTHPEQVVVIGCHYDGEAVSTQSANDDGSGCAIELGVAKAMGEYWRSHHVYPARTLRFVIFDAEEQGIFGSFHYLNETVNGDTRNIVAMFNEEQNGIAYPLRYLGKMENPLLPFYIETSPLKNSDLYPHQDKLSTQQKNTITHFSSLMQQAITPVFQQFQELGFQTLAYHNGTQDSTQPVFSADQQSNIHQEEDVLGGSDQIPFTLAGLPCATFAGNSTYYDPNPPSWSYPFDQPQDTIQLMNTFASGSSQKAEALTLALALPGMLTTWMLHQPDILGEAQADNNPIAAISDIGLTVTNQNLALDAHTAFVLGNSNAPLTYTWNFGDGTTATGVSTTHTYTQTGQYTLTLTVASPQGSRHISKTLNVVSHTNDYYNLYASYGLPNGSPPVNNKVHLPVPTDSQSGSGQQTSPAQHKSPAQSPAATNNTAGMPNTLLDLIIGLGIILVIVVGTIIGLSRRRTHV